ncbi:hypothetical protein FTX61_16790 [Nitriliruptoraceae bacterium ZYF776]|nr:hypothetical protein [Profundirhabdus halotolerans]
MIPIPACAVVTAPIEGRLTRHLDADTPVRRGDVIATLASARGELELTAPVDGCVGGSMLRPTQAVAAGEGVVWVSRHTRTLVTQGAA